MRGFRLYVLLDVLRRQFIERRIAFRFERRLTSIAAHFPLGVRGIYFARFSTCVFNGSFGESSDRDSLRISTNESQMKNRADARREYHKAQPSRLFIEHSYAFGTRRKGIQRSFREIEFL